MDYEDQEYGCRKLAAAGCHDRWQCAGLANWENRDGLTPWGANDDPPLLWAYLIAMEDAEREEVVEIARSNLDTGYWQGFPSPNGGYEDGPPWNEIEVGWRATAADFMERVAAGERWLTEGMLQFAAWDLCRELAWVRGWCPISQSG